MFWNLHCLILIWATAAFFWISVCWYILHPYTFNLSIALHLSGLLIYDWLLFFNITISEVCRPFTINAIIDRVRFRSTVLLFSFYLHPLFISPLFLSFLAFFWIIWISLVFHFNLSIGFFGYISLYYFFNSCFRECNINI